MASTDLREENLPAVSIILSAWNDSKWLPAFMESVFAQDYKNFELLVVNDASSDHSGEILASYADPRIRLFTNHQRRYWANAVNDLCAMARGRLLKLICADDLMRSDCLSRLLDFYEKNPQVGYISSDYSLIDEHGGQVGHPTNFNLPSIVDTQLADEIFDTKGCWVGTSSLCVPRERWIEVGGLQPFTKGNPDQLPTLEDFELLVRLHDHHAGGFIAAPIVHLRTHPQRLSENMQIKGLMIAANLSVMKAIAARRERYNPHLHATEALIDRGAAYINLGISYSLNGRPGAGFDVIRSVLQVLPVTRTLWAWVNRVRAGLWRRGLRRAQLLRP